MACATFVGQIFGAENRYDEVALCEADEPTSFVGNLHIPKGTMDFGASGFQNPIYVDDDAPSDPGPGDPNVSDPSEDGTQAHPFDTIQEGIDAAEDGNTVVVWPGIYTEEIDFLGKAITLTSGTDAAVLRAPSYYSVSFYHGEEPNSVLKNFVIKDSYAGILVSYASPTIQNVTVVDNESGIIAEGGADPIISNSIFWNNTNGDLFNCQARYSCVQRPNQAQGEGNITVDPCFADPNNADPNSRDYHLLSERGRYRVTTYEWILDHVTSPCIDAGNSNSDWTAELWPHGKRINMGAYGGIPAASMSLSEVGYVADLNNDGFVDMRDLFMFIDMWLAEDILLATDINHDGIVNFIDFAELLERVVIRIGSR
jgi:hypothetical protein